MQHLHTVSPTSIADKEYSGSLNKTLSANAKDFSLLVSMLQQNLLERPRVVSPVAENPSLPLSHFYRREPLAMNNQGWGDLFVLSSLLNQRQNDSARLWQAMHPSPLALRDDVAKLTSEVVENMDINAQKRQQVGVIALKNETEIPPEPPVLYDILQRLEGALEPEPQPIAGDNSV